MQANRATLAVLATFAALAPFQAPASGPAPLAAQRIAVRLDVNERTGGAVGARFDSALGALDEVEVVGPGELAHYALDVSVLCVPRGDACASAESYAVSVVLSEPLTPGVLKGLLVQGGEEAFSEWRASLEAEANLQRYRTIHALWSTWWGRDRFGADVDRLVRSIDVRCFEKRRILERMPSLRARGDTTVARNQTVTDPYGEGEWLC